MKRIFLFVFIVLVISTQVKAQVTPGKFTLGAYAGGTFFTSTGGGNSFQFGAELGYNASKNIGLIADFGAISEKISQLYEVSGNARIYFPGSSSFKAFGEGGLGIYNIKVSFAGFSASKSYGGINIGLGGIVNLRDNIDAVLKVKYHNPFISGSGSLNWVNATVGINVNL